MAQLLQPVTGTTDPRILRSRRMLMDSLVRLLKKKEFEDISVQEIADEASLNRATFYLHYPDKNALLQAMTDARFRDLIERRSKAPSFPSSRGCSRKAFPVTGWHPVSMRHYWRPRRPGPSSGPRAAG